jgi:hypothetical protein
MIVSTVRKSRARIALAWGPEELAPGRTVSPGSGPEPVRPQQRADLRRKDPDAELGELAPNPDAAPRFSRPIRRMSSGTASGIVGLPPADLRRKRPLPSHELPVSPKERLRAHEERRPPSSRKRPADRGHESPVATAKTLPAHHLALQDLRLVTKDHELDFGVQQFVGGAGLQPDHESRNRYTRAKSTYGNLLQEGGPKKEARWYERLVEMRISGLRALQSSTASPWRRSREVTRPRSRPRAAMASTASSRRVVSFPFFHSLRSEHLGGGPVASKLQPPHAGVKRSAQ